jgi:hypothetical protein
MVIPVFSGGTTKALRHEEKELSLESDRAFINFSKKCDR